MNNENSLERGDRPGPVGSPRDGFTESLSDETEPLSGSIFHESTTSFTESLFPGTPNMVAGVLNVPPPPPPPVLSSPHSLIYDPTASPAPTPHQIIAQKILKASSGAVDILADLNRYGGRVITIELPNKKKHNVLLLNKDLGKGGCGKIFYGYALDPNNPSQVVHLAIKETINDTKPIRDAMERELEILQQLGEHKIPNTISLFGHSEKDGKLSIALPLYEFQGSPLSFDQLIATKENTISIFIDIFEAVYAMHDKGLIHRDIKPQNVFITADAQGDASGVVGDFGTAIKNGEKPPRISGTKGFMHPRYFDVTQVGKVQPDKIDDQFALVVMICRRLYGFDGKMNSKDYLLMIKEYPDYIQQLREHIDDKVPDPELKKLFQEIMTSVDTDREPYLLPKILETLRGMLQSSQS